jgi:thiamine biosynthesis lipoprotein ApbE
VTVIARDGWRAEVLAKAAFVAGTDDGLALFDTHGVAGAIFDRDDHMRVSSRWPEFAVPLVPSA